MKKLAIVTTHPIQYYAPVFKILQSRSNIRIRVFYTLGDTSKYDHGFGKKISWDIPLLDGYDFAWVNNTSADPGSHNFKGVVNPGLNHQIDKWQPDAILIYGWAYKGHLKAIRYFKNKVPVYFRGDSTLLNESPSLKSLLKYIFLRWVYSHIDHAFYVGKNNRDYYKKYGLKDRQLSFAPHAVDNERFNDNRSKEAAELRSSLKIKEEDILILFAGKFDHVKNVDLLLEGFGNLNQPNVHLLLVGNGLNELVLKAKAAEKENVAGNIHFLNFQNQTYMPVVYQAADLFCLPSISETWGLSINEAMACGRAILVSDKTGCAVDLVKPGINGEIFNAGDINVLTENLKKLVNRGKSGLLMMGECSKKIIEDWTFEKQVTAIELTIINE